MKIRPWTQKDWEVTRRPDRRRGGTWVSKERAEYVAALRQRVERARKDKP